MPFPVSSLVIQIALIEAALRFLAHTVFFITTLNYWCHIGHTFDITDYLYKCIWNTPTNKLVNMKFPNLFRKFLQSINMIYNIKIHLGVYLPTRPDIWCHTMGLAMHSADSFIKLSGRHTTQTVTSEVRWTARFSGHWVVTSMFA